MLTFVGGIYDEHMLWPADSRTFGSAGRGAIAVATLGANVELKSYGDFNARAVIATASHLLNDRLVFESVDVERVPSFHYEHGLKRPDIWLSKEPLPDIKVNAELVVRFGMIEGNAVVHAYQAVYDPQNVRNPEAYVANGSSAERLALVLNRHEAESILQQQGMSIEEMADELARQQHAEVVVIKMGPMGAYVHTKEDARRVPAYRTSNVWKVGTGDQFVANFAYAWMQLGLSPTDAADRASRATAWYCEHNGAFPTEEELDAYHPSPINVSADHVSGVKRTVYLAGPFFTMAEHHQIEEARAALYGMGLKVFSPYHQIGPGSADEVVQKDLRAIEEADLLLALGDHMDAGTVFEIGYARALDKPVIFYAENEKGENIKMMQGSDCEMATDFVTAIYLTSWRAAEL